VPCDFWSYVDALLSETRSVALEKVGTLVTARLLPHDFLNTVAMLLQVIYDW
jgi:hypothetical protein